MPPKSGSTSARVTCPVCGLDLAASSLPRHKKRLHPAPSPAEDRVPLAPAGHPPAPSPAHPSGASIRERLDSELTSLEAACRDVSTAASHKDELFLRFLARIQWLGVLGLKEKLGGDADDDRIQRVKEVYELHVAPVDRPFLYCRCKE